ncbi:MAG: phage portal protein [Gammaproteobacteria bacterium]|nr:MAG: phage portal protein [Gammaproteobacteria bacterium]
MFGFKKKSHNTGTTSDGLIFSFDDAVAEIDKRELLDMFHATWLQKYYQPPISLDGLAKSLRSNSYHESAIMVKRNIILSTFNPHPRFSLAEFEKLVTDFLVLGNAYLKPSKNRIGGVVKYHSPKARWVRVGKNNDFYYLRAGEAEKLRGVTYHLKSHDLSQDIYGVPEYLSGLNSAWLNEAATLFRRKYYINGSHAGYILHITDDLDKDSKENLEKQLKASKGLGNFKNLLLYSPSGKKDGVNLIPIAEVTAKDEFYNIKTLTRDDILAAHRVPPQLMSVIPLNTAGFGDVEKASKVFVINELLPLQTRLKALNDMVGEEIIRFGEYALT